MMDVVILENRGSKWKASEIHLKGTYMDPPADADTSYEIC